MNSNVELQQLLKYFVRRLLYEWTENNFTNRNFLHQLPFRCLSKPPPPVCVVVKMLLNSTLKGSGGVLDVNDLTDTVDCLGRKKCQCYGVCISVSF
jgi:hypothetical protein